MAVAGYIGGILHAVIGWVSAGLWILHLSYLLSGVGVMVFNKLPKLRESGHACGVAGPTAGMCNPDAWMLLSILVQHRLIFKG